MTEEEKDKAIDKAFEARSQAKWVYEEALEVYVEAWWTYRKALEEYMSEPVSK